MDELITDLETIRQCARAQEDEDIRFRQFLRYRLPWSDSRLDSVVQQIAREVEAVIDCTRCANCCRVLEVSLGEDDLARLADHLGMTSTGVAGRYAIRSAHCALAFAQHPCAFLHDNRCQVYPARPGDCRAYPHLDKADFRTRMWQLLTHAENCPIIFNVLQRLKQVVGDEKECW